MSKINPEFGELIYCSFPTILIKFVTKISFTVHLRLTSYSHIKKEFGGPGFEFKGWKLKKGFFSTVNNIQWQINSILQPKMLFSFRKLIIIGTV